MCALSTLAVPFPVVADAPASSGGAETAAAAPRELSQLRQYVPLLQKRRLFVDESASVEELELLIAGASEALVNGKREEAEEALLSVIAEPRYASLDSFPAYGTAELLLASILTENHALTSAQRIVDRILARGADQPAFGSAFRRGIDIALKRGDLDASATHLARFAQPTGDTASELAYLRGLASFSAGRSSEADQQLGKVTTNSRFYADAQYLLGAMAAREKRFAEAEKRFCSIAGAGKNARFPFFVDGRFFPVRDLSMLGLGRVAHETGRADDAFFYYFQVPNDSPQVSEALFEAAWASYEGRDHDTAIDSLDQLRARFPRSPRAAEAAVLRGYVHLARCEFAAAEKSLLSFEHTFAPVLREADAVLDSPAARTQLYGAMANQATRGSAATTARGSDDAEPRVLLLSLLETDPEFARISSQLRALDAELARSGRVPEAMRIVAARLRGKERPSALPDDAEPAREAALDARFEAGEAAVVALEKELRSLARAGADGEELRALRGQKKRLDIALQALQKQRASVHGPEAGAAELPGDTLEKLLEQDARNVREAQRRAHVLRGKLEAARDARGCIVLSALRERLADELRRSRIGRVDAVMGAKRKIELEVESLSAGRFPPELRDTLRTQGLLRDDEEYWPFEGDDWPDEFEERYTEEEDE
jgi:TolA-binding protein